MSTTSEKSLTRKRQKYLAGAMRGICELMREYKIPWQLAETELQKALKAGYSQLSNSSQESQQLTRLCDVCARWYLENEFVDSRGIPKPLSWNGKSGTLKKLVTRVVGSREALPVIKQLIDRKLIRRTGPGRWAPKSRVVAPTIVKETQIARCAAMIARLLRTVVHNSELKYKGDVLLEVMAQVPRLKTRDIPSFQRFSKAQGISFIKTVDDWLESRNLRRTHRPSKKTIEAGVIAFAFYQPRA
jgi:hypothetical protein